MERTLQTFLKQWIHIIKEWADALLRKKKGRSLACPRILRKHPGKECILLQLERNTPGAVSTWRFNGKLLQEQSLLITLDNIADLNRHFQRIQRQKNPVNTRREVVNPPGRSASHRIGASLVNPLKRTEFIGVWDVNLIDPWSITHAEDYKAERILLYTALRILTAYEVMPEFFVNEIRSKKWWEQRIRYQCEGEFSINHQINLTLQLRNN